MQGYLYILQSEKSGRYYIGSCLDPGRRLMQHNANAVSATRNKGPWRQRAVISFANGETARAAEAFVKKQKSRRVIEKIIAQEFAWTEIPDRGPT